MKNATLDSDFAYLDEIIGITKDLYPLSRDAEIDDWLANNEVESYVIIDDKWLSNKNLIKTKPRIGIDTRVADQVIAKLNVGRSTTQ